MWKHRSRLSSDVERLSAVVWPCRLTAVTSVPLLYQVEDELVVAIQAETLRSFACESPRAMMWAKHAGTRSGGESRPPGA